jgi:hypothetical protein
LPAGSGFYGIAEHAGVEKEVSGRGRGERDMVKRQGPNVSQNE